MANNQELTNNNELDDSMELIFNEFGSSMLALQTQDIQSSEQSLLRAKNAFNVISMQIKTNDVVPFKIMCNLIEVTTRLLKSTFLGFEERFKKAIEELEEAQKVCDDAALNFMNIPIEFRNDNELGSFLPLFKTMFICFDCLITSTKSTYKSQVLLGEGKFVDEIAVLRNSVENLRKINNIQFEQDPLNLSVALITMINKIADLSEKRVERLEEKRKKIDFIKPIDKRVFIVHGHNVGILNELNTMLKYAFNIEPIILSEMADNGNTVIEKFENYGRLCAFAFVIITPDDLVENKKKKYFQGRPNVLFELGWFCGRFGRDKVRILRQKDTQLPSDLNGLVTIDFHEKLEEVFRRINTDLESNGIIERRN